MSSRIRLNSLLLPIVLPALLIMQLINPSRVWMVLLICLGGLWLAAFIWSRQIGRHLSFLRELRFGWIQVGDLLEERFTIKNTSLFPAPWVEIEDRSTLPGYNASLATGANAGSTNLWRKSSTCTRRGVYQLGETLVHSGDPFGIYTVTRSDMARSSVIVLPPVVPLPALEIVPGGYCGEGRPKPNAPMDTIDASSVREYQPGDGVRLVHWKTSARQEKLFVRLFEGAPASDWWILLDLHTAVQVGQGQDSTEEHAIILAASLAERGLREKRKVGLVINSQPVGWLPARGGSIQRWEILHALALARGGATPLAGFLEHIRTDLGHNASLLVITPSTETDWLPSLVHLRRRGIAATILALEPGSFGATSGNLALIKTLDRMGFGHHNIPRAMLDLPEAAPGQRGKWEWHISPTGKAIPVRAPGDEPWRKLT